jgi:hypothetical protein
MLELDDVVPRRKMTAPTWVNDGQALVLYRSDKRW